MSLPTKDKSTGPVAKTIRLEIDLFEPTRDNYPEFNFLELVRIKEEKAKEIRRKKESQKAQCLPPDPFNEDADVLTIAKHFEKKYSGAAYGSVRLCRGVKRDDYADIAAGYDETDSFIDNTDAYDEIIPRELETKMGGFYINSGPLEYEKLPNCEGETPSNRTQKRQLSSSTSATSSDESTAQKEKKFPMKKVCLSNNSGSDNVKSVKTTNGLSKSSSTKDKLNYNPLNNNTQKTEEKIKSSNGKNSDKSKKFGKTDTDKKSSGSESSKSGQNSSNKLSELNTNQISNNTTVKKSSNTITPVNKDDGNYCNVDNTAKKLMNSTKITENGDDASQQFKLVQELLRQKKKHLDISVELVNPDISTATDMSSRMEAMIKSNNHIL